MGGRGFTATTIATLSGFLIWAAHFLVIYGFAGLACARGFSDAQVLAIGVVPFVVGAATILAGLATAAILWLAVRRLRCVRAGRDEAAAPRFLLYLTATIAGLSLVAIIWEGLPILFVPACQ